MKQICTESHIVFGGQLVGCWAAHPMWMWILAGSKPANYDTGVDQGASYAESPRAPS